MLRLKDLSILEDRDRLTALPEGKLLINTINAHSYNTALKDTLFAEALTKGDALIPDGASIVKACGWINAKSRPTERIAGWDLFTFEMEKLNKKGGTELGILYDNIISLCNERGIKGGKMCTDIGMSKGILTDLKMGRQTGISATNAQKIASYFGVSVGYLLGEEEKEDKKEKPTEDDRLSDNMKMLIDFAKSVPEDKVELVLKVMKSIVEAD
jgi:transcriptional regulator with XRE-family HTH domain